MAAPSGAPRARPRTAAHDAHGPPSCARPRRSKPWRRDRSRPTVSPKPRRCAPLSRSRIRAPAPPCLHAVAGHRGIRAYRRSAERRGARPSAPWRVPAGYGRGCLSIVPDSVPAGSLAPLRRRAPPRCGRGPGSRFRVSRPRSDRALARQASIDRGDWEIANDRIHVGFERRTPLRRMLRIAPTCPVLFDKFDGALAEGPALGVGNSLRLPLSRLCVERVYALVSLLPMFRRLGAGLRERYIGEGSKSHVAPLAVELEPENPGFRSWDFDATHLARRRDAEVKPAAIV